MAESNVLTFYGHSAFCITTTKGLKIWIDPWLDNPEAPENAKADLQADLILITHGHGDHLGNCMEMATSSATEIVAIHEIQQFLLTKGIPNVTGMNIGGTYITKGISITMVPAVHSSSIQDGQDIFYGGEAAGFIIGLENGTKIYHAGDTALFGDMAIIGNLYAPKVALIPIGDHYVMGPKEAAYACKLLNPSVIVPMHYGTFPVLTGTVGEFERQMKAHHIDADLLVIKPGESAEID
ncbi:MAG: metal-dependent hydrolase [Thermodesulfobacteria bacterium]|nr:metal-dependent hydrolase [Thermodesulfobacteriota bacterium]